MRLGHTYLASFIDLITAEVTKSAVCCEPGLSDDDDCDCDCDCDWD